MDDNLLYRIQDMFEILDVVCIQQTPMDSAYDVPEFTPFINAQPKSRKAAIQNNDWRNSSKKFKGYVGGIQ